MLANKLSQTNVYLKGAGSLALRAVGEGTKALL